MDLSNQPAPFEQALVSTPLQSNLFTRRTLLFFTFQWIYHLIVVVSVRNSIDNYNYHRQYWGIALGGLFLWVAILLLIGCFRVGRNAPLVLVIYGVFTLLTGYLWTALLSFFNPDVVIYVVALLTAISGALFLAAAVSKEIVSVITGILFSLFAAFIVYETFVIFSDLSFGALVLAAVLAALVGVFIVYDIQSILLVGSTYALDASNGIAGSIILWLDLILIVVRGCEIIGRNMRRGL
eukprot:TRINITY_DN290_c0_g1_i1.p1 TRINITY_DN290_c0_g1~~TRINITY_DN290_c0_g1_i1.p1  ORF type:complete len:238 (+),score=50.11 TRINITY_DN290_c0_g1_i1:132-845(+)